LQAIIRGQWEKKKKLKQARAMTAPAWFLAHTRRKKSKIMSRMRQESSGILKGFNVRDGISD
jgi:hypothetical protein